MFYELKCGEWYNKALRCSARTVLIPIEEVLFQLNAKLKKQIQPKDDSKTNVVLNKNKKIQLKKLS